MRFFDNTDYFVYLCKNYKEMEDFLSRFQKSAFTIQDNSKRTGKVSVFFQIDFAEAAYVTIVDEKGVPVNPDYRLYQGEVFNVLRMVESVRQEQAMRISWGTADEQIRLSDYPYLLFALLRCQNLVDKQMRPVTVTTEEATIVLIITTDERTGLCTPQLAARCSGAAPQSFQLLSDVFVLAGQTIHPVASLGENYQRLSFFMENFPRPMLEQYLSVFYTYVDNVALEFEDYQLVCSEQTIPTIPTVIIEKVDADMALYLRLSHTLKGLSADFGERFDLSYVAQLQDTEHQVMLRHVVQTDFAKEAEELRKNIIGYAPNRTAAKEVWQQDGEFIIPQETAGPFLLQALPMLASRYQLLGAEKLREYKVKAVRPKMKLGLSSGIDFLEGTATISLDGEELSLRKFLQQYNKQKYITLSDGNRALIDETYVRRLERIFKKAEKGKSDKVRVSFFDLPDIENLLQEKLEGKVFEHHRQFYEGFNQLASKKLQTKGVKATLRNYQKEGVKWINYLYDNNMGGCLADDMGLGKTLQTITMLTRVYPKTPTPSLLVMPRSLLFNWQDELKKFAPQLTYYIYYGGQRNLEEAMKQQLVLTTYALVRNDIEQLRQEKFHYIILDESQNIKNLASQATQAILLLNGAHRLALSGTPIENNLTELYSLFRFLNPAMLGSAEEFNREYAGPIQRDANKEATESLRRKIFPFMLRRLKKDVLKELPDRMEQTLYVEMDDDHRRFYEERRQYYQTLVGQSIDEHGLERSQMVMFQALSELRRISSVPESLTDGTVASPKIPLLCEQIEEAVAGGHKVVVFFNFIAGIELVGEQLTAAGIDYATMTGSTHDRRAVIERFQQDPGCRVLLMTLKTGGVGLNLTVADTVYIFEPWWNKAAEEQAINRLHRIGQKAKVMSYALITRDTIEEKIRLLQQQKKDLADSLITGDQAMTKHLSEEDIKYILG
jgi:superfamily II DNA or RNA helicase